MPNLSNLTGPASYGWSPEPVATAFLTTVIPRRDGLGSAFVSASPTNGVWPAGVVLSASASYPGTLTPSTISPTGVQEALFNFTPSGPGSGMFSITASGPGITSVTTPTPTPAPIPTPVKAGTFSGVPASGTAGSALVGTGTGGVITFTASNIATPYAALVTNAATVGQAVGSALIGSAVALSGTSGTVPAPTPTAAGTVYLALLDGPTGKVITRSNAITVAAASGSATQGNGSVTLTGVPSTIVAGQLLSGVTYTATGVYFVLYRVAGAVEEGARFVSNALPGNLILLVPQIAGAYTIRVYDALTGGALVFESTQMNVTAAPGPLPAQVTQTADTGATQTGVTMNWTATAASYRFLARSGFGVPYGNLVDTTLSTNSYTFTGQPAGSGMRAIVIPQNANGFGPPSDQIISATSF